MAYNENLADRIRAFFVGRSDTVEKNMMGGLVFMVNDKMCVCIMKDDLMVRFDPAKRDALMARPGAKVMDMNNRVSKGFLLVGPEGLKSDTDFAFWIQEALSYNGTAKSSKKASAKK